MIFFDGKKSPVKLPPPPLPSDAVFWISNEEAMIGIAAACGFTHPPQKLSPHSNLEAIRRVQYAERITGIKKVRKVTIYQLTFINNFQTP